MNKIKKHAYLILAHSQPNVFKYLLMLLDDIRNDIFVHIDSKVDDQPFVELRKVVKQSSIIFTKQRFNVQWGRSSQTMAEMCLYETAVRTHSHYTYYHLLSGVDLPIKSQNYIHNFFLQAENAGKIFLFIHPNPSRWDYERFSKYHFQKNNFVIQILNRLQNFLKVDRIKNKFPIFKRGHNWCSLTHEAVLYLLNNRHAIKELVKLTICSDEGYKQLFILNSPELASSIKYDVDRLHTPNLWEVDWVHGGAHPLVFTINNYIRLITSQKLFARKFSEEHIDLVEKIYNFIREEN